MTEKLVIRVKWGIELNEEVLNGLCEHASTASFFASRSSDQICLVRSEHY